MELVLSEENELLRVSAATLVERSAGPARHRALRSSETGFDRARLTEVADAGWLGLMVPDAAGGLGLGTTETALVLEQAGRGLMTEPIAAQAAIAAAIADGGNPALAERLLPRIMAGETVAVPAFQEAAASVDFAAPAMTATAGGGGGGDEGVRLAGTKCFVAGALGADGFVVNAASGGEGGEGGEGGQVLCYVARDAGGVALDVSRSVDGGNNGTLTLSDVAIDADNIIAGANAGAAVLAGLFDRLSLGLSAEMLGVMEQAHDLALGYIKTREQFGRTISSFQALQHRAVNDHIEIELLRSLLYQACAATDGGHSGPAMCAAVKARASEAVLNVTKSAIQMHGAIGFTDEYDAGLYLRRAMTLAAQYGNAAAHRARYAAAAHLPA